MAELENGWSSLIDEDKEEGTVGSYQMADADVFRQIWGAEWDPATDDVYIYGDLGIAALGRHTPRRYVTTGNIWTGLVVVGPRLLVASTDYALVVIEDHPETGAVAAMVEGIKGIRSLVLSHNKTRIAIVQSLRLREVWVKSVLNPPLTSRNIRNMELAKGGSAHLFSGAAYSLDDDVLFAIRGPHVLAFDTRSRQSRIIDTIPGLFIPRKNPREGILVDRDGKLLLAHQNPKEISPLGEARDFDMVVTSSRMSFGFGPDSLVLFVDTYAYDGALEFLAGWLADDEQVREAHITLPRVRIFIGVLAVAVRHQRRLRIQSFAFGLLARAIAAAKFAREATAALIENAPGHGA